VEVRSERSKAPDRKSEIDNQGKPGGETNIFPKDAINVSKAETGDARSFKTCLGQQIMCLRVLRSIMKGRRTKVTVVVR